MQPWVYVSPWRQLQRGWDTLALQPGFNADYAPAFRRNAVWVRRSQAKIAVLLEGGTYLVHRFDQRGIVLRHVQTGTRHVGEPSDQAGTICVQAQFDQALQQMQRTGDASLR